MIMNIKEIAEKAIRAKRKFSEEYIQWFIQWCSWHWTKFHEGNPERGPVTMWVQHWADALDYDIRFRTDKEQMQRYHICMENNKI